MTEFLPLSVDYERHLATMLRAIGQRSGVEPDELTGFWPRVGHKYDRRLMVVGKAVNGWHDSVVRDRLAVPAGAAEYAQTMRRTAAHDDCPMSWVTLAWGKSGGYSTARSAFWRFARQALIRLDPDAEQDPLWSGRLAWSNLAKIAPWSGGNPAGKLLAIQRELGPALLREEIETYDPAVVLVTTGRWWFEPFADGLGLDVDWRVAAVEGYAEQDGRRFIVGPHPQAKTMAIVTGVLDAVSTVPGGAMRSAGPSTS